MRFCINSRWTRRFIVRNDAARNSRASSVDAISHQMLNKTARQSNYNISRLEASAMRRQASSSLLVDVA